MAFGTVDVHEVLM